MITIESVQNGVLLDAGGRRMVYELRPGRRTQAVHDLLAAVATELAAGIEVRIEVLDPRGQDTPVTIRPQKRSLNAEDIEAEYGIPARTLEDWRASGKGPPYVKPGKRVIYLREDFEDFLRAHIVTSGRG